MSVMARKKQIRNTATKLTNVKCIEGSSNSNIRCIKEIAIKVHIMEMRNI